MECPTHTSRKKLHLWGKTLLHFSVFFATGFIAPFVPWDTTAHILSNHFSIYNQSFHLFTTSEAPKNLGRVLKDGALPSNNLKQHNSSDLVIVITTTRSKDKFHLATLTRLAHSLANVSAPLLWLVVEARNESRMTTEMLRGTRIMYRHLTYKDNFTNLKSEIDHQRNIALRHIERHTMAGIVHFADSSIIYDLKFFEEIRKINNTFL
ncbi:hypothetical protein LUZ60_009180 [Juncus effusus]|nr:hypothetical protein LUZ60_009180 [Juncus effusus]